jgi:hypothetical protein
VVNAKLEIASVANVDLPRLVYRVPFLGETRSLAALKYITSLYFQSDRERATARVVVTPPKVASAASS